MENIEVSFEYNGFEFYVYQSKIDAADTNWYMWSPSGDSSDDKIGVVANPFKDFDKFSEEAESLCKKFIEDYTSHHEL